MNSAISRVHNDPFSNQVFYHTELDDDSLATVRTDTGVDFVECSRWAHIAVRLRASRSENDPTICLWTSLDESIMLIPESREGNTRPSRLVTLNETIIQLLLHALHRATSKASWHVTLNNSIFPYGYTHRLTNAELSIDGLTLYQ